MRLKLALVWAVILALILLPVLACTVVWGLTARPAGSLMVVAPLSSGRKLDIDVLSCTGSDRGSVMVWYIDASNPNRFIDEKYTLLLRVATAPACP
jgi:hypothetical protein